MPEVKKIKGYIYDDGNNVSVEASVFEGESVIARSTFSLQMPNCQSQARQWLRKQGIPDELIEEQHRHNRDDQCKLDPETSLCSLCGVEHGPGCQFCGASAFHTPTCCTRDLWHD
jgi:hypothetical protein